MAVQLLTVCEVIKNEVLHKRAKISESFAATVRKLRSIWGIHNGSNESTVRRLIEKFNESGFVINVKRLTCVHPAWIQVVQIKISQPYVVLLLKVQPLQFDTDHRKCS